MELYEGIMKRCSIRKFNTNEISEEILGRLIEAAIRAPSGKNGQPWKFRIVSDREQIERVSRLSMNEKWMNNSNSIIIVFLDKKHSYHYIKDVQSCGAAIQNILLAATSLGIGSCWIGDNINKSEHIKEVLHIDGDEYEYMGLVALGYYDEHPRVTIRRQTADFFI